MTEISDEEKKKLIAERIESSGLPQEVKDIGVINAMMGMDPDALIQSITAASNSVAEREAEKANPEREFAGYTPVEKKIAEMLTENTGVDMLDSGGAYGRHWQENRKVVDFRTRPEIEIETYVESPQMERIQKRYIEVPYLQKTLAQEQEETIQVPKVSMQITRKPPTLKLPKKELNTVEPSTMQNNIPIPSPVNEQPKKQTKAEEEKERLRA